ncbi:hypothetical protein [Micromonospora sp. NPDC092111]|uniref:hypothetical protein n=1 Tax=Micromonospora sp. NPDC092111 TaxID=3364289 RepID=UPI00382FB065
MSSAGSRTGARPAAPAGAGRPYRSALRADGPPLLTAAFGRRGVVNPIRDGLSALGWSFDLHDITPLPTAFRMMVNERSFHVAEMALTTLAMAIEHGRPMIGLPVVLNRDFHYRSIVVGADSGIRAPEDLIGRRVGVRAYSQTTGVWVRGLLASKYDIAPEQMRWVTFEAAHVAEYVDPPHVTRAPDGASIAGLLASGDLDAAVIMDPHLDPGIARPLFPDAPDRARSAYESTGIYPVNHVVAVDTALLEELPGIADELYGLFLESKRRYQRQLREDGPTTAQDEYALQLEGIVGGDFNPYGLAANRESCATLIDYAHRQGLLRHPVDVDDIFHHPACP